MAFNAVLALTSFVLALYFPLFNLLFLKQNVRSTTSKFQLLSLKLRFMILIESPSIMSILAYYLIMPITAKLSLSLLDLLRVISAAA